MLLQILVSKNGRIHFYQLILCEWIKSLFYVEASTTSRNDKFTKSLLKKQLWGYMIFKWHVSFQEKKNPDRKEKVLKKVEQRHEKNASCFQKASLLPLAKVSTICLKKTFFKKE